MSITLNSTAVAEGDVVIEVDAATGTGNTTMSDAKVIGVPAIAAALGVDEGRVSSFVVSADGRLLSFSLSPTLRLSDRNATSNDSDGSTAVAISDGSPSIVSLNASQSESAVTGSGGGSGLSDGNIVGRLVVTLGPWASQVAVQRAPGSDPQLLLPSLLGHAIGSCCFEMVRRCCSGCTTRSLI